MIYFNVVLQDSGNIYVNFLFKKKKKITDLQKIKKVSIQFIIIKVANTIYAQPRQHTVNKQKINS